MSNQQVIDNLKAAKEVIKTPESWTQREFARTSEGIATPIFDKRACKFCALGALRIILLTYNETTGTEEFKYLLNAAGAKNVLGVAKFNDTHTHDEVLALYDRAIELATEKFNAVTSGEHNV